MTLRAQFRTSTALPCCFALTILAVAADVYGQAASVPAAMIGDVRIGIANCYKVGHWTPVRVEVRGGKPNRDLRVEVIVEDSDGVATRAAAPLTLSEPTDAPRAALIYTKVGRIGAPIRIRLFDGETPVDERVVEYEQNQANATTIGLPATAEMAVALSSTAFGFNEALPDRIQTGRPFDRKTLHLSDISDLPTNWFGYDAVDVLVIAAGDGRVVSDLSADEDRYAALVRWVELGGKLVILCGGDQSKGLLSEDGPLADLAPGRLTEMVQLRETGPLEHFAEPAGPIQMTTRDAALIIPRLANIDGRIAAYAGRRPSDLPIVVRSARGFGELAFASVDLSAGPLAEWADRPRFLQALIEPYVAPVKQVDASQAIMTLGYNDLSGALRQRLGRSFAQVVPLSFSIIAGLAIAYLLVLGPIDYLLVQRYFRQPLAGWITLPLLVLIFGFGALGLSEWRAGIGGVRMNQVELVDIDLAAGLSRGTLWATLYSADAGQFDLAAKVDWPGKQTASQPEILMSWWGLPGLGIGGMQAAGVTLGIVREAYLYSPTQDRLNDVPILASSTKSFVARWTAPAADSLAAQLSNVDGYATGTIMNRTSRTLRNARLLYGGWAYRLGNIAAGQQVQVGEHLDPRRVKTIVTSGALRSGGTLADVERSVFVPEEASALQILSVMMFYRAAGGMDFARLPNEYDSQLDLSRHVELNRAVLVAEADGTGSILVNSTTGEPLSDEKDFSAVVMRWVLPVQKIERD